jgi:hypothetical protein
MDTPRNNNQQGDFAQEESGRPKKVTILSPRVTESESFIREDESGQRLAPENEQDSLKEMKHRYLDKKIKLQEMWPKQDKRNSKNKRDDVFCVDCQEYIPPKDMQEHPIVCLRKDINMSEHLNIEEICFKLMTLNEKLTRIQIKIKDKFKRTEQLNYDKDYLDLSSRVNMILNCLNQAIENDSDTFELIETTKDLIKMRKFFLQHTSQLNLLVYNTSHKALFLCQEVRNLRNFTKMKYIFVHKKI